MGILLTTFGLVWLLLIAASVQFQKAKDDLLFSTIVQKTISSCIEDARIKICTQASQEFRKYVQSKKPGSRKLHSKFLNVSACILDNNPEKQRAVRYMLEKLLPMLYEGKLFTEIQGKKQSPFYKNLIDHVFECAKTHHQKVKSLQHGQDLANVQLALPEIQSLFMKMMKGMYGEKRKGSKLAPDEYPSLFEFMNIDHRRDTILSFTTAPKTLLLALFQDKEIVDTLSKELKSLHGMEKGARKARYEQIKMKYIALLPEAVPMQYIDFTLKEEPDPHDPDGDEEEDSEDSEEGSNEDEKS
jgi:hypothetical protein